MSPSKSKAITALTGKLHDSIDDIYESLMEGRDGEALTQIEAFGRELKHLKSNIVIKEN